MSFQIIIRFTSCCYQYDVGLLARGNLYLRRKMIQLKMEGFFLMFNFLNLDLEMCWAEEYVNKKIEINRGCYEGVISDD